MKSRIKPGLIIYHTPRYINNLKRSLVHGAGLNKISYTLPLFAWQENETKAHRLERRVAKGPSKKFIKTIGDANTTTSLPDSKFFRLVKGINNLKRVNLEFRQPIASQPGAVRNLEGIRRNLKGIVMNAKRAEKCFTKLAPPSFQDNVFYIKEFLKLRQVKQMKIHLFSFQEGLPEVIDTFMVGLKRKTILPKLEDLTVEFFMGVSNYPEGSLKTGTEGLGQIIRRLEETKKDRPVKFDFQLNIISLTNDDIAEIPKILSQTSCLDTLHLKTEMASGIRYSSLISALKGKENIRNLIFEVRNDTQSEEESLSAVCDLLKEFTSLRKLQFHFKYDAKLELFNKLAQTIGSLTHLEQVAFYFFYVDIVDDTFLAILTDSLHKLANLSSFGFCIIGEDARKGNRLTQEGTSALFGSFEKLTKLKNLSLKFEKKEGCLTNKSLKILSSSISQMNGLKTLDLKLSDLEEEKDGVCDVFEALRKATALEALEVDFSIDSPLSEAGVLKYVNSFKGSKNISKLNLVSPHSENCSLFVDTLKGVLSNCVFLQDLNLQIHNLDGFGMGMMRGGEGKEKEALKKFFEKKVNKVWVGEMPRKTKSKNVLTQNDLANIFANIQAKQSGGLLPANFAFGNQGN